MSIYSVAESGTRNFKSRYTKSISNTMRYDCRFHELIPVLKRFCLPGDVWRIGGDALIRFLPMKAPSMTGYDFYVRYFFVNLRQIEENTELIITGSKDGHLYESELPVFKNFVDDADKVFDSNAFKVRKYRFWDYMNVQTGDYEQIKASEFLPAQYWYKAYCKIMWDYYFDENYNYYRRNFADFETFFNAVKKEGADAEIFLSSLRKDYFNSALPWQLKGNVPTLDITGLATFTPNYQFGEIETGTDILGKHYANNDLFNIYESNNDGLGNFISQANSAPFSQSGGTSDDAQNAAVVQGFTDNFSNILNQTQQANITGLGFNADEFRVMMAQTRIFERLARCGSRYTEYLYSNFGTAPADETLQRPKYLGGWKIPIVTSEVLQTAQDSTNPVGTMRGHGISRGGNRIKDFYCKEFGVIFGIAEVRPDIQYTTGIPRQLTYKRRFDFFNPSLQHLSEQEVRNGELFISNSDGKNDDTFGFQAYGNELRSYQNETVGELRDTLADWNQALAFSSRPNLNNAFISGQQNLASFNRPFVVQGSTAYPIIVQFYNNLDVYRPMVRYATPGLVDHL